MEKIPHTSYVSILLNLKFGGLSIGYSIGRKYRPIRVLVLDLLNQNSGFSHSLQVGSLKFRFLVFISKTYLVIYRGMSDLFCSKCESSQFLDSSDDVTQGNILALCTTRTSFTHCYFRKC